MYRRLLCLMLILGIVFITAPTTAQATVTEPEKVQTYNEGYDDGYRDGSTLRNGRLAQDYEAWDGYTQYPYLNGYRDGYIDGYHDKPYNVDGPLVIATAEPQTPTGSSGAIPLRSQFVNAPRYIDTTEFGMYEAVINKLYQVHDDGSRELVVDLGEGTGAYNASAAQEITDWRSFYITDLEAGYFYTPDRSSGMGYECILISGLVFIPDPHVRNRGMIADIFVMYYPQTGWIKTIHVNHRYPMTVSAEQYQMKEGHWYDYLNYQLFPRGIISQDNSLCTYLLTGEANLNLFKSKNQDELLANGYGAQYWELRKITNSYEPDGIPLASRQIYSLFYGPVEVFESKTRIPELSEYRHTVDPSLIVFSGYDNYNNFLISSIGTDDSQVCTALEIDLTRKTEDYYWLDRNEFIESIGVSPGILWRIPWGSHWSERYMDLYIDD